MRGSKGRACWVLELADLDLVLLPFMPGRVAALTRRPTHQLSRQEVCPSGSYQSATLATFAIFVGCRALGQLSSG